MENTSDSTPNLRNVGFMSAVDGFRRKKMMYSQYWECLSFVKLVNNGFPDGTYKAG
jgi:hypothetical protein